MVDAQILDEIVAKLETQGWVKKFVVAKERLHEVVDLYIKTGHAVCILPGYPPPTAETESACATCWTRMCEACYFVLTRTLHQEENTIRK